MKSLILIIVVLLPIRHSLAQHEQTTSSPVPIKWMTFEQAVEKSKTVKKKIFIDLYTDWCGWCKVMDQKTFTDPVVAQMLNDRFYPVKFNAEQKEDVVFNGTTFRYVESGRSGYHQLAASLLNNQLSYPNFVFLTEDFRLVQMIPGYTSLPGFRKPEEFHLFLSFVGNDHYKKMNIEDYQKVYQSPYAPVK